MDIRNAVLYYGGSGSFGYVSECLCHVKALITSVGGPDRPPSKRMMDQMRADEQQGRDAARSGASSSSNANQQDQSYWAYMQQQVQQRTERLNIMGDSMDRLEEASSGWAEDVNKFVSNQKKQAMLGCKLSSEALQSSCC